jgi:hypothetical protein
MQRLFETIKAKLTAVPSVGLIMDNGDRADPRDPIAMERARLSSTRAKNRTSKQMDMLEDLDFIGGIWSTETGTIAVEDDEILVEGFGNVCVITGAFERMLLDQAKMLRLGQKAKTAFLLEGPYCLKIDGKPLSVADVWENRLKYRIRRRVRTFGLKKVWIVANRPMFRDWSITVDINFFPNILDAHQVTELIETSGIYQGLGSYRPKYGRFDVEILDAPNGKPKGKRK